jgi:Putative zinc-finger
MSHDRFQDRLLDLAYGELSPREAREVEAHAASCAECGAELGRIRATRRVMGALPDEQAPDAGERILLAAAREAVRDRAPKRLLPAWAWSASVVAALVVAVGTVSYRILAMRPAAERAGEELLGRGQYAEAPSAPALAEEEAQVEPSPSEPASPAQVPSPARVAKRAEPSRAAKVAAPSNAHDVAAPSRAGDVAAPSRGEGRALVDSREERAPAEAAPTPPAHPSAPSKRRAVESAAPSAEARQAPARRASEADDEAVAPEALAGFAEPPTQPQGDDAPSRSDSSAPRSQSAGAPAAAPTPSRALAAPQAAAPDRSGAALARYSALRGAGSLSGEIRTFTDCEGESWRKVERDPEGRTVKYVREGRVGGRQVRVEHLFAADGSLAAVRVSDLERGGAAVAPGALGLSLPRDASEAGADAEPRCER